MTKQMMVLIALILYVLFRSLFVEPNSLEVNKYEIEDNLLQGVRIVFLSDFHLKKHDYKRLDKIVMLTNKQQPDIVLMGGDFANGHNNKNTMDMNIAAQKLNLINAPIYTVLGNHDWWSNGKEITSILKQNGISVLANSAIRTIVKRRYLDIIGLEDLTTRQPNVERAFSRTRTPRIVITHNPDVYYDIMDEVSLILAGHTHGGQFVLPFTPPLFVPSKFGSQFASGLIMNTHNKMIITKGLGTSILPVRLNCKPEIVVVDFVKKGTANNKKRK